MISGVQQPSHFGNWRFYMGPHAISFTHILSAPLVTLPSTSCCDVHFLMTVMLNSIFELIGQLHLFLEKWQFRPSGCYLIKMLVSDWWGKYISYFGYLTLDMWVINMFLHSVQIMSLLSWLCPLMSFKFWFIMSLVVVSTFDFMPKSICQKYNSEASV